MTDQVQRGSDPGGSGPGPDGAGFTYRPAEQELIVVARPEARLRAQEQGVRSATGSDVSALNMFLGDEQLVLEPLFGSEDRLRAAAPETTADVPVQTLVIRVRGGGGRAEGLSARMSAGP
ncbi:serine protease, partial [Streptomyces lasiicapitis]